MASPSKHPKGYAFIAGMAVFVWVIAGLYDFMEKRGNAPTLPTIQIGSTVSQKGEYYKVLRVIDGDTIEIDMRGNKEKVRLLGINTPETVDSRRPVQCFGKEANTRMKQLSLGEEVYLEFDDSQSLRDTYDRLLAYVYLKDGQMLNRKMLAEGYAYEYTYLIPYSYQKEFRELVKFAKESKRGLWADETCKGVKSS